MLVLPVLASGCFLAKYKADTAAPDSQQAATVGEEATPSVAEQATADVAEMEEEISGADEDGSAAEGEDGANGSEDENPEDNPEEDDPADPRRIEEALPPGVELPAPDPNIDVPELYRTKNCASCHGDNQEGTKLGPPLAGLDRYWEVKELEGFLQSPAYYLEGNKRLVDVGRTYNLLMPPSHMTRPQRYAMAYWLLGIEKKDDQPADTGDGQRPSRPKKKTGGGSVR
ncbi:cytochrome c [bacterium]|nr:cytochrome c [bacterium]